jgi:hypothetical protein
MHTNRLDFGTRGIYNRLPIGGRNDHGYIGSRYQTLTSRYTPVQIKEKQEKNTISFYVNLELRYHI